MRQFKNFDDMQASVGDELGVSDWTEVTQDRITAFAKATGDEQWLHVDVERARRELPSKGTIAHGLLTLALAPAFVRAVAKIEGLKHTLNYGADRVRYLAPVPAGSLLRGRVKLSAATPVANNGLKVTYSLEVEMQGGSRPVCVAELIAIHYC